MSNINTVTISGNLTKDPKLYQSGDMNSLSFSIAVDERTRDKQTGEWTNYANYFDVVFFGQRAIGLSKILHKGMKVCVHGRLRFSSYKSNHAFYIDENGQQQPATLRSVSIYGDNLDFMSRRSDEEQAAGGSYQQGNGGSRPSTAAAPQPQVQQGGNGYYSDEDVPF